MTPIIRTDIAPFKPHLDRAPRSRSADSICGTLIALEPGQTVLFPIGSRAIHVARSSTGKEMSAAARITGRTFHQRTVEHDGAAHIAVQIKDQ